MPRRPLYIPARYAEAPMMISRRQLLRRADQTAGAGALAACRPTPVCAREGAELSVSGQPVVTPQGR